MAFLFDLDGVIVDSMPLHIHAWTQYLARHGRAGIDLEERLHGRRNDEIVKVYWEGLSPEEAASHGAAKESLFREMMEPVFDQHLIPGVREFIRDVAGRPLGLGSNAERPNIEFTLSRAGLNDVFGAIVDGDQVERPKPFPDIYLKLAKMFERRPADCIVFEDSPTGVAAARAAGMRVVGVDTGRQGLEGVDIQIQDFTDPALRPWLERTLNSTASPL